MQDNRCCIIKHFYKRNKCNDKRIEINRKELNYVNEVVHWVVFFHVICLKEELFLFLFANWVLLNYLGVSSNLIIACHLRLSILFTPFLSFFFFMTLLFQTLLSNHPSCSSIYSQCHYDRIIQEGKEALTD